MAARAQSKVGRAAAVLLLSLVAACAAPTTLDPSARFDADSDKAIVVVGASVFWGEEIRDPDQSLTLHWQAFDPETLRLLPDGASFDSLTRAAVRLKVADPLPAPRVLQVEPGSYALVAAGSGSSKSFFVPVQDRYRNRWGQILVNDVYLDPRKYIEPQPRVAYGNKYLFSVAAGQIVYLGHFAFDRPSRYSMGLNQVRRVEDEAAARAALVDFPGIEGTMIVVDPTKSPLSAAR